MFDCVSCWQLIGDYTQVIVNKIYRQLWRHWIGKVWADRWIWATLQDMFISPLKFFITNFFAVVGLLFARGDAWRLNPLLGFANAEKFALFCASVMSESFNFLWPCKLVGELRLSLCFRFLFFVFPSAFCCSCRGDLEAVERGMHSLIVAT